MSRHVVCDASAVVAVMVDAGADGRWASERLIDAELSAPSLLPYESANIFRRHERAGVISSDQAAQAHADLLALPVDLWPYELLAKRIWELRNNLSSYDAAYVALAEALSVPLVTLDGRIPGAPGIRCAVECPPAT